MHSGKYWRVAAWTLPTFVILGAATIAACRDGTSSINQPDGPTVSGREALRTRHAWIGAAHNKAIDDFRKELRRPGLVGPDLCDHLAKFLAAPERLPQEHRRAAIATDPANNRRALDVVPLCGRNGKQGEKAAFFPSTMPSLSPIQSASAGQFLLETEESLYAAVDSYDLTRQLNGVLDRSLVLAPVEQDAIAATVSVAQSSFEYWPANYAAFEQEVIAEYGDCGMYYASIGYTAEQALQECVNKEVSTGSISNQRRMLEVGHSNSTAGCGTLTSQTLRDFAAADAKGAFTGFFTGALTTAGTGAFAGALLGGGGASIAFALDKAFMAYWCVMTRKRPGA